MCIANARCGIKAPTIYCKYGDSVVKVQNVLCKYISLHVADIVIGIFYKYGASGSMPAGAFSPAKIALSISQIQE